MPYPSNSGIPKFWNNDRMSGLMGAAPLIAKRTLENPAAAFSFDLKMLDNSHKRLENPHSYPVGIEENLYKEKKKMILNLRK